MSNISCKEAISMIQISKDRGKVYEALSKAGLDTDKPLGKLIQVYRGDFAVTRLLLAAKNQLQFIENNPR